MNTTAYETTPKVSVQLRLYITYTPIEPSSPILIILALNTTFLPASKPWLSPKPQMFFPCGETLNTERRVRMVLQLPDDIITNILHRLPVKSLVRFKCVCKLWNSLIPSRQFVGMHLHHSNTQQNKNSYILSAKHSIGVLHFQTSSSLECDAVRLDFPHPLNFYAMNYNHEVVGCCNGLICILISAISSFLVIWNPSTREYMRLPDPGLGFYDVYGFGYDSSLDVYKIVRFSCGCSLELYRVKIYNLETNSSKEIEFEDKASEEFSFISMRRSGTLLNGALYWLVWTRKILRVDLIEDKVSVLPLPNDVDMFCTPKLGVSGGHLCVFQNDEGGRIERTVNIWLLKQDGKESPAWSKLLIIPQPKEMPTPQYFSAIDFTKNGQVLMCIQPHKTGVLYYMNGTTFTLYNPEDKSFKKLTIPEKDWQWSEQSLFVETLPAQTLVSPTLGDKEVQAQLTHAACIKEFGWWFARCRSKVLPLVLGSSLFGFEHSISLSEDDVDELCRECGKPTPAMFVLYMKALYAKMKRNGVKCNLAFPELISPGPEWINPGPNMLTKRLDKSIPVMVPLHISKPMEHWSLAVIVPFVDKECVFWFDSLNTQIEKSCTEKIEDAINTYRVSTSEGRKKIIWEQVKCRKQAANWESGFYVMMFMRDILMREKSIDFTKGGLDSRLTCYPTEQSVVDDIYLLKWELLEQYRGRHPEYEPEEYI